MEIENNTVHETSDGRETWHWNTWIRYLPVVNIIYGGVRALVYGGKAAGKWKCRQAITSANANADEGLEIFPENQTKYEHGKEIIKSLFTVLAGVLGIIASYYTAVLLCGVIQSPVTAWLMKLVGEMITGQLVQNAFIVLGDIITSWSKWKLKSKDEWEELANTEMIKIPFVGCLYSLLRPFTCKLIGKFDLNVRKESAVNALINIFASNVGLGAGYAFHIVARHPHVTSWCHQIWDRCQWADEFGRLFFVQRGWLEKLMLSLFPSFGKGLGSWTQYGLNSLAHHL